MDRRGYRWLGARRVCVEGRLRLECLRGRLWSLCGGGAWGARILGRWVVVVVVVVVGETYGFVVLAAVREMVVVTMEVGGGVCLGRGEVRRCWRGRLSRHRHRRGLRSRRRRLRHLVIRSRLLCLNRWLLRFGLWWFVVLSLLLVVVLFEVVVMRRQLAELSIFVLCGRRCRLLVVSSLVRGELV